MMVPGALVMLAIFIGLSLVAVGRSLLHFFGRRSIGGYALVSPGEGEEVVVLAADEVAAAPAAGEETADPPAAEDVA